MIYSFMQKKTSVFCALILLAVIGSMIFAPKAKASYKSDYLIKDSIFIDNGSMGVRDIQQLLLDKGSYLASHKYTETCNNNYMNAHYLNCGKSVLASQIIYDAARAYGLNPRTIIATMQKEESLITDPSPSSSQVNFAMGYACPDSGGCGSISGFFNQVDWGTWQLRLNFARASGDNTWSGSDSTVSGYACPGRTRYYSTGLYPGRDVTFYDDYGTAYTHFVIANAATASLYCYTPHVYPGSSRQYYSGSYWFVYWFEQWFGSVASPCYNDSNVSGATGRQFIAYRNSSGTIENLTHTKMNNTGSACVEAHLWNNSFKSWLTHVPTGMASTDPNSGVLVSGNVTGDSKDELIYMRYGNVQVHEFSSDLSKFLGIYDVPTNLTNISATTGTFVAGDFLGRGSDQLIYIRYSNAQNNLELHMFSKDLRKATGVYDVVNSLTNVSKDSGVFVAGDFLGRGYDQLAYIKYSTDTKAAEVHIFSQDLRKSRGFYDVSTGLSATSDSGTFVAGSFNSKKPTLEYIKYDDSAGQVEIHSFSSDLRKARGIYDVITNLSGFSPPL